MKKLTKNEVRKASTFQLTVRYNHLISIGETMPVKDITMADAREIIWIEEELHHRLIKAVGHDLYPPNHGAKYKSI